MTTATPLEDERWTPQRFAREARAWVRAGSSSSSIWPRPDSARDAGAFFASWAWRDRPDHWSRGYLESRIVRAHAASDAVVEVHVALCASYGVPLLLFRGSRLEDAASDVSDNVTPSPTSALAGPAALVTPQMHPVLEEAFRGPHACATRDALQLLLAAGASPPPDGGALLAWWSLVAPALALQLAPDTHAAALAMLRD